MSGQRPMDLKKNLEAKELGGYIQILDAKQIAETYAKDMCEKQRDIDADFLHVRASKDGLKVEEVADVVNRIRTIPLIKFCENRNTFTRGGNKEESVEA